MKKISDIYLEDGMDEEKKTFAQLVEEKATCFEFAWNGYIRLYEEGEKKCECKSCLIFKDEENG